MNKYSDKSDFEINKAAAGILKLNTIAYDRTGIVLFDDMDATPFDPCNNPADAMPIILDNGITLSFNERVLNEYTACCECETIQYRYNADAVDKTVYRAAMEVFLMMKGTENEKV